MDKALDFNPNNVTALQQTIGFLTSPEIGKHQEAIGLIKRYISIHKEGPENKRNLINGYNRFAMAEWKVNELDSAFVHIQKAIDIDQTDAILYTTLAEVHLAMNNKKLFYSTLQKSFDLGLTFRPTWFLEEPYITKV